MSVKTQEERTCARKEIVIQATGDLGVEPGILRDNEHILNTGAYAHVEPFLVQVAEAVAHIDVIHAEERSVLYIVIREPGVQRGGKLRIVRQPGHVAEKAQ